MNIESLEKFSKKEDNLDLGNEEVVNRLLTSGSSPDLEKLKEFHQWNDRQIEIFSYFGKLRQETHKKIEEEVKIRRENNPFASEEELEMGAYWEAIEPQVREAVADLRKKGYHTFESGFSFWNKQQIHFENRQEKLIQLPEEIKQNLEGRGVIFKAEPDSIAFSCEKPLTLEELKSVWETIIKFVPDLEKKVEPNQTPAAESFRIKQERLRKIV